MSWCLDQHAQSQPRSNVYVVVSPKHMDDGCKDMFLKSRPNSVSAAASPKHQLQWKTAVLNTESLILQTTVEHERITIRRSAGSVQVDGHPLLKKNVRVEVNNDTVIVRFPDAWTVLE